MTFGFWIHVMLALLEPNFGYFYGIEIEWHESDFRLYTTSRPYDSEQVNIVATSFNEHNICADPP